ncbi:MAG: hypothetical protein K6E41_06720 [Solobacterium sp.]|nr:hypothetical protein [Solobacterium sp.]
MRKKFNQQDLIWIAVFLAVLAVQIWKAHRGPGYTDEHFYLAVADRIARGDAMLYDLWDIGQLMAFFTFPLVKLYRAFFGGTQGIVLAFRLVYTAMTMGIGAGIYLKFRKDTPWSVLASAIFMLYTPFNIMAPSYNTLAIGFLMIGLLVYPRDHRSAFRLWLCGVMMAAAVLNSPYFILMYVFLTAVMIRNRRIVPLRSWVWITAGAVSLACVFLGFVLSRAPLGGVLASLPELVDSAHSANALMVFAKNAGRLVLAFGPFALFFAAETAMALLWRRKEEKKKLLLDTSVLINTCSIIWVTLIRPYYPLNGGFTVILVPFAVLGIAACLLYEQDPYYVSCLAASIGLAFCISLSTNVGPNSYAAPLIIACAVLALLHHDSRGLRICTVVLVCLLGWYKVSETFGNSSFVYHTKLEKGPLAGLYAAEEEAERYEQQLKDIQTINGSEGEEAVLLSWNCWEYLALDKRIVQGYTYPYFYSSDDYFRAEDRYLERFPEKRPALIAVDKDNPYVHSADEMAERDTEMILDLETVWLFRRK